MTGNIGTKPEDVVAGADDMDNKEKKEEWINWMVKELDTEEKLRADLSDYYELMNTNQKMIYILSDGLLSKPNYTISVFKEFLEKYCGKQHRETKKEILKKIFKKIEYRGGMGNRIDAYDILDLIEPTWREIKQREEISND